MSVRADGLYLGQKVKVDAYDLPKNILFTGTIRSFSSGILCLQVELDQECEMLHTCKGAIPSGKGWNCEPSEVTPIDEVA